MADALLTQVRTVFREFSSPNAAGTGVNPPRKSEVAALHAAVIARMQAVVDAVALSGSVVKITKLELDAVTGAAAGVVGLVLGDADEASCGIYLSDGAGGWTFIAGYVLPAQVLADIVSLQIAVEPIAAGVSESIALFLAAASEGDARVALSVPHLTHKHVAADINDASTLGRSLLKSMTQAQARGLLGAASTVAMVAVEGELANNRVYATTLTKQIAQAGRPGDAPGNFTSQLTGAPAGCPPIDEALARVGPDGRSIRVLGAGIIATRPAYRIEPGRRYMPRMVVRRAVNPVDPAGDAVALKVQWLDASKNAVSVTTIATITDLVTGSGRQERLAVLAAAAGDGIDIVAPGGAVYFRPYVQTFGDVCETDIQTLDLNDVTNSATLDSPDLTSVQARLSALESIDTGDRLDAAEAVLSGAEVATCLTRGALAAAEIPAQVTFVNVVQYDTNTEAFPVLFKSVEEEPEDHTQFIISADARIWEMVPQANMDVRQFGLVAGSTMAASNNSARWQAAADFTALKRVWLRAPKADEDNPYWINQTFRKPNFFRFGGAGKFETWFKVLATVDRTKTVFLAGMPGDRRHDFILEDFAIDANFARFSVPGENEPEEGSDEPSGFESFEGSALSICNSEYFRISRVYARDAYKHAHDVLGSSYGRTGVPGDENYADEITRYGILEDVEGEGCGDDAVTVHQSEWIWLIRPRGKNGRGNFSPANYNGVEIDDGCRHVFMYDGYAEGVVCGFEIKGHADAAAARGIVVKGFTAVRCVRGWRLRHIGHRRTESEVIGEGEDDVLIPEDPVSTTAFDVTLDDITVVGLRSAPPQGVTENLPSPYGSMIYAYSRVKIGTLRYIDDGESPVNPTGSLLMIWGRARNIVIDTLMFEGFSGWPYGGRVTSSSGPGTVHVRSIISMNGPDIAFRHSGGCHTRIDHWDIRGSGSIGIQKFPNAEGIKLSLGSGHVEGYTTKYQIDGVDYNDELQWFEGMQAIGHRQPAGMMDIKGATGKANLVLRSSDVDIVVPTDEVLQFGHIDLVTKVLTERMRINTSGNVLEGKTVSTGERHQVQGSQRVNQPVVAANGAIASFRQADVISADVRSHGTGSVAYASANAVMKLAAMQTTNRSMSAAGTINASGADYSEYWEVKPHLYGSVAKGALLGVAADGLLTDRWSEVIGRIHIKSTAPNLVGDDGWSSIERIIALYGVQAVGEKPSADSIDEAMGRKPVAPPAVADVDPVKDAQVQAAYQAALAAWTAERAAAAAAHNTAMAEWVARRDAFDAAMELERRKWDRIAFCGKVPANVSGLTVADIGKYLVPVEGPDDTISAVALAAADLTPLQYITAFGTVIAIGADGRPIVSVKVN